MELVNILSRGHQQTESDNYKIPDGRLQSKQRLCHITLDMDLDTSCFDKLGSKDNLNSVYIVVCNMAELQCN